MLASASREARWHIVCLAQSVLNNWTCTCAHAASIAIALLQNGAVWRGYVGSDGKRYKSASDFPSGVHASITPGPMVYKADALLGGQTPNAGAAKNLCHVECSNRGMCDASSGTCKCFVGYYGEACSLRLDYLG